MRYKLNAKKYFVLDFKKLKEQFAQNSGTVSARDLTFFAMVKK